MKPVLRGRSSGGVLRHEFWLDWQRLNTPDHRERFDGGVNASLRVTDALALPLQIHIVHEGGQLHAAGPVTDSAAIAGGVSLHHSFRGGYLGFLELFGLVSRYVPDRSRPELNTDGAGFFGRAIGRAIRVARSCSLLARIELHQG